VHIYCTACVVINNNLTRKFSTCT